VANEGAADNAENETEPFDAELLVEMYGTLQDQTHAILDQSQARLRGGLTAIVAIFGYAILGNEPRLYALLPFVVGGLVIVHLESAVTLAYLNHRMSKIERKLETREPLFVWEREYGILGDGRTVAVLGVDLNPVFFALVAALVAAVYVAAVWLGLTTWVSTPVVVGDLTMVTITTDELLVAYGALTAGILMALVVAGSQFVRLARTSV
jgi:hypothetical protein